MIVIVIVIVIVTVTVTVIVIVIVIVIVKISKISTVHHHSAKDFLRNVYFQKKCLKTLRLA